MVSRVFGQNHKYLVGAKIEKMTTKHKARTETFFLPKDWQVVVLREIVEKTEKRDPRKEPDQKFKYIDISSVSNKDFRVVDWKEYVGREAPSRARKIVKSKDTIFATVRPYLKNIALIPDYLNNEICSTGFCVIRANEELVDPDFLFFALLSDNFVGRIVSKQKGSSYPAVSDKVLFEQSVTLPPLPEQRAIAHVLSTVREAIEATERVIAAARELKRSLMKRTIIDELDEIKSDPLEDTVEILTGGTQYKSG
jgi:type I restriction enzyme S subunit